MPRPKLDPKVTEAISDWLNTPADSRDVRAGAELLLTLNRNRAIYNAAVRRPAQLASKIEHELRKYLNIRLHDAAVSDLRRVESEVMPQVSMTLDETMYAGQIDPGTHHGRRPDHDSLPADIRALYDGNGERYRRMVLLFNELKAMSDMQPCDRLEKLLILKDLDTAYRKAYAEYDAYEAESSDSAVAPSSGDGSEDGTAADPEEAVTAARKNISKYRKTLASLSAGSPRYAETVARLKAAVDVVVGTGGSFSATVTADLSRYGVL